MKRILAAAATATIIGAGGAFAQTPGIAEGETPNWGAGHMQANVAHMQEMVSTELARSGIDVDVEDLTLRQLNELALVLDDESMDEQARADQVRQIIEN